jgi:hypothetical protein
LDDGEIILDPTRVGWARSRVGGDMVEEIAQAEVDIEEVTPMVVIMGWEV